MWVPTPLMSNPARDERVKRKVVYVRVGICMDIK